MKIRLNLIKFVFILLFKAIYDFPTTKFNYPDLIFDDRSIVKFKFSIFSLLS